MALRNIVTEGDETLRKTSKEVKNFGERTRVLLDDMWETLRNAEGVGLAAPQVGVLRRAIVIDVTEPTGEDEDGAPEYTGAGMLAYDPVAKAVNADGGSVYELLNPEIVASEGETCEREGCLSIPGVAGVVGRPERVIVKAMDREGNDVTVEGTGLLAKALCHEIDHLNGILFTDIAEEIINTGAEDEWTRS
ncbi:MAG: peptide deformylase [Clostridiales Family XIII bacterium]|jgi:peptide deformylase|nr:peptide deformylase [Clostridiales Family XIII bacterium]